MHLWAGKGYFLTGHHAGGEIFWLASQVHGTVDGSWTCLLTRVAQGWQVLTTLPEIIYHVSGCLGGVEILFEHLPCGPERPQAQWSFCCFMFLSPYCSTIQCHVHFTLCSAMQCHVHFTLVVMIAQDCVGNYSVGRYYKNKSIISQDRWKMHSRFGIYNGVGLNMNIYIQVSCIGTTQPFS